VESRSQLRAWSTHSSSVYDLAFSPDDRQLATSAKDMTAWLLDVQQSIPPRVLHGHVQRVYGVSICSSTGRVSTGGADGAVKVWRQAATSVHTRMVTKFGGTVLTFSPDGESFIETTGAGESIVHASDGSAARVVPSSVVPGGARVAWYDRGFVLSGGGDVGLSKVLRQEARDRDAIEQWDYDADGDQDRVTGVGQPEHVLWQENLGDDRFAPPRLFEIPEARQQMTAVSNIDDDPDLEYLCLSPWRRNVVSIDFNASQESYQRRSVVEDLTEPAALIVADLNSDQRNDVVVAIDSCEALAWYEQVESSPPEFRNQGVLAANAHGVNSLAAADLLGNGKTDVVATRLNESTLLVLESTDRGKFVRHVLELGDLGPAIVDVVDFDEDGDADILVASADRAVWLENQGRRSFSAPQTIESLEAEWSRPLPPTVAIYDRDDLQSPRRLSVCTDVTHQVAMTRAGDRLAVATYANVIQVWDLKSDRHIKSLPTRDARTWDLAYSRDGRFLLAAVGDYLHIWDAKTYELISNLKRHENSIQQIDISARSDRIVTVSDDLTVRLSALPPHGDDVVLLGNNSSPRAVKFSDDGQRVVTGSVDGAVRIWDVRTGQELLTLDEGSELLGGAEGGVRDVAIVENRAVLALIRTDKHDASFVVEWRAD
jgi:WD40 repeat protein